MPFQLSQETIDALRDAANASATADLYYEICMFCGMFRLVSVTEDGTGQTTAMLTETRCDACASW